MIALPSSRPLGFGSRIGVTMARGQRLCMWLSTDEFLRLAAAAEALAMRPAVWVRCQALRAAGKASDPSPSQAPPRRSPGEKLTRRADTRLTEEQFEAVDERARACGLTVASFLRELILGHRPIWRRPLARSAIVAVDRASASLDRLVQLGNSGTLLTEDVMRAVARLQEAVHSLRDALLRIDAANSRELPE
jgi:hypothetical protein